MKLYFHPISTACRPIMLLAADEGLALDNYQYFVGGYKDGKFLGL